LRQTADLPMFYIGGTPYDGLRGNAWISCVEEYNGEILVSGTIFLAGTEDVTVVAIYNNEWYYGNNVKTDFRAERYLGVAVFRPLAFDVHIPYKGEGKIAFYLCVYGAGIFEFNLGYTYLSRMKSRQNSFVLGEKCIITRTEKKNEYLVTERNFENVQTAIASYVNSNFAGAEFADDRELLNNYVRFYEMMSKRRIWMFMDRRMNADDNAEALFKYCINIEDGVERYFVIDEKSPDYERLSAIGNVLKFGSPEHKLTHLFAECYIGSDFIFGDTFPFGTGAQIELFQPLTIANAVFLQHGIIKDDMSSLISRWRTNTKLFITGGKEEYKSILYYDYGYTDKVPKLTGLPRYDYLYNNTKKQVVFVPTWRNALSKGTPDNREYNPEFVKSDLFLAFNALLNDERLVAASKKYGYELLLRPHPHMYIQADDFSCEIIPREKSYRDIYAEAALMITDYSSAIFDFAYLKKPVLYYQFDERPLGDGYFDYERDGFGDVVSEHDVLVDKIIQFMETGCEMSEEYKNRVDDFFAYRDKENCKRVYGEICKL